MVKVAKPSRSKKLLLISTPLVVASLFLGISFGLHSWPFHKAVNKYEADSRRDITANPSPKNNNLPDKSDTSTTNTTSDQVPIDTALTAKITEAQQSGNTIHFTASTTNAAATGTCVVTFSNPNDRPVTKQFSATDDSGSATCSTNISAFEFSYLGQWTVEFHYYLNDKQATASSTITIK
jgi:hypothetical protein